MRDPLAESVQATFAATLTDEWRRCGVRHAVVCPGSRSTPLAVALLRSGMEVHVVVDERSAGFVALGLAEAIGSPVVVVTTSGTAAVELHPAIVEAHHAGVPVIAATADRPPELHGVGAPQVCDQRGLFGRAVRWEHDPGVARREAAGSWRSLAARAIAESRDGPAGPGPVHLNLPFSEPLVGDPGPLPEGRSDRRAWHEPLAGLPQPPRSLVIELAELAGSRGVVVSGRQPGVDRKAYATGVAELAASLGWPVLADPLSGLRREARYGTGSSPSSHSGLAAAVVCAADALLRAPGVAERLRPEVVVRFGRPWASRVVNEWLAASGARQILVDPFGGWPDPDRVAGTVVRCDPVVLCAEVATAAALRCPEPSEPVALRCPEPSEPAAPRCPEHWLEQWGRAEEAAQGAIGEVLGVEPGLVEPWIARSLVSTLPASAALVVSSSLPVREVEWFSTPGAGHPTVFANRGVNGIDGVVSTACGVARSGWFPQTVALVGDLAFLHDAGALMGFPADRSLTVVVVDNQGGGIFDFLPPAAAFDPETFAALFRTPQRTDPLALATAHGADVEEVSDRDGLEKALGRAPAGGARVVVCRVDPSSTVEVHRRIEEAVAASAGRVVV